MTPLFRTWLSGLVVTALLTWASILWLDKPIAILVHDTFGPRHFPQAMTRSPGLSIPLAAASVFAILGLLAVMGWKFRRFEIAAWFCGISILGTDAIKNQLKYVFGRTWPDSWDPQILSLIRDNVYGFNFFHHGRSFESFPSGHAAVAASIMSVLWLLYPRLRTVWVLCLGAADIGLVLLNLHFLSDVVAGTFVGVSSGIFTVALCAPMLGKSEADSANGQL